MKPTVLSIGRSTDKSTYPDPNTPVTLGSRIFSFMQNTTFKMVDYRQDFRNEKYRCSDCPHGTVYVEWDEKHSAEAVCNRCGQQYGLLYEARR